MFLLVSACGSIDAGSALNADCDVSPRLPEHPVAAQMRAPAGAFPVWFVTIDTIDISELDASLSPYNGGTIRKSLVVVSTELDGDLTITGHQLGGDAIVLFPTHIDEETTDVAGRRTIIYSDDDLSDQLVIHNAQVTTNSTTAAGYAHHPWAAYYPVPGCYQISGTYGTYTSTITVEIRGR
ncbi:MAG: hypothetical protein U0694_07150 [Anaerolineae bacterium]